MFGRILLGLALCLNAAPGDGGGGAGASNASPPPPAPPAGSSADLDKARAEAREAARREARAEFLKEQGFDSEEAYKAHLDEKKKADEEKKKAEDAKLSEGERAKKLLNEALDARGKVEAKLEAERAARKAAEDALALRDRLDAQGVLPSERKFVEVELHDAEAAAKKAGKPLDEAEFFKGLREKRPYFFGKDAPQLATTSTNAGAGARSTNGASNGIAFDASKLSDAEWAKWRQENNV